MSAYHVKKLDITNETIQYNIVNLLNETFINEREFDLDWFHWKHINSPFGMSLAWGVWIEEKLVAVRLYSKWRSIENVSSEKFVQALDTATHPKHQRKGLFKLLILESLKYIDENGISIFNFPNEKSLPQYVKYGWQRVGGISLSTTIINLFKSAGNDYLNSSLTASVLQWRYELEPNNSYLVFKTENSFVVFRKVKGLIPYSQLLYLNLNSTDCNKLRKFMFKHRICIVRFSNSDASVSGFIRDVGVYTVESKKSINVVTKGFTMKKLNSLGLYDMDFL